MIHVEPLTRRDAARLIAIGASRDLGRRIADRAGIALLECEEEVFADGEMKLRPVGSVVGETLLVLHSLSGCGEGAEGGGPGHQLVRLLILIGALRDAGAGRVIVLTPYLAFARQDRRSRPGDPLTSRYVARLLEAMGSDAVAALEVHNVSAFESAFSCPSRTLSAAPLFASHFMAELGPQPAGRILVVSPDAGGTKRARHLQQALAERAGVEVSLGLMDKRAEGEHFAGSAKGKLAILVDDLVSSGGTLAAAAAACRRRGAEQVHAAVTHAVLTPGAGERLARCGLDSLVVTDSIPGAARRCPEVAERLRVLDCSEAFAGLIGA